MTTADALTRYLAERRIIDAADELEDAYAASWFYTEVRGRRLPIYPMVGFRGGIALHDVHHMLTGYETSCLGECELAGWELASGGCGLHLVFWLDRLGFLAIGLVVAPRRTLRAFRRGLRGHNLYGLDKERVLSMPLCEVERYARSDILPSASAPTTSVSESSTREE